MKFFTAIFILISGAITCYGQVVSVHAGVLQEPGYLDGNWDVAQFNNPHGMDIDKDGNIFVADRFNHVIRKIDTHGVVTTVSGKAGISGKKDGPVGEALFNAPWGLVVDDLGNIFVADTKNNCIRKIAVSGEVTTFAGSGANSSTDGPQGEGSIYEPTDLAFDLKGNLIVVDHLGHSIRKVNKGGFMTTIAGIPGTHGADDGPGHEATFYRPYGLCVDKYGDVFVADEWNHMIRKIDEDNYVTTVCGTGVAGHKNGAVAEAQLNYPWDITVDDNGNFYVGDGYNYVIRKIDFVNDKVTSIVGTPQKFGGANGLALNSSFSGITSLVFSQDQKTIYVADAYNDQIRKVELVEKQGQLEVSEYQDTLFCPNSVLEFEVFPKGFEKYQVLQDGEVILEQDSAQFKFSFLPPGLSSFVIIGVDEEGNGLGCQVSCFQLEDYVFTSVDIDYMNVEDFVVVEVKNPNDAFNYLWSDGQTGASIKVTESGMYAVKVSNDEGCEVQSDSVFIDPVNLPILIGEVDNELICAGDIAQLTSNLETGVDWYKDSVLIAEDSMSIHVDEGGEYYFSSYFEAYDTVLTSSIITVNELVVPEQIKISTENIEYYDKTIFEIGFTLSDISGFQVILKDAYSNVQAFPRGRKKGELALLGWLDIFIKVDFQNGCSKEYVFPKRINVIEGRYYIPNAFSPNGDDLNDVFRPIGLIEEEDYYVVIYNQWNKIVFESRDKNESWDGTFRGEKVPNGNFIIFTQFMSDDELIEYIGTITVLR